MQAIITAIVNPQKAMAAYTNFLKVMMPEYEEIRDQMDKGMMSIFHREQGFAYELTPGRNGWAAKRVKRD